MGVAQFRGVLFPIGATVALLGCGSAQNVAQSTGSAAPASMSSAVTTTSVAPSVTQSVPMTTRPQPTVTFPTPPSRVTVDLGLPPVLRPRRPASNAGSTVPNTRPPPPPIPQGPEYRTIADVIETPGRGPEIAFLIEASLPPRG